MSRTPNDVSGVSIVADLMAMIKRSNVGVSLESDACYGSEGIFLAMIKRSNVGVSLESDACYGSEGILPLGLPHKGKMPSLRGNQRRW